jgi:hypothetical protein
MKRLQKSFASAPNNTRGGDNPQPQSFDSSDTVYHEKENNIPLSATNATNDTELPIDSTIVSIAERAVAVNFPSSYIRPVPIKREDIHGSLPRTDGKSERSARTPVETQTPTHGRASDEIFRSRTIVTDTDIAGIEFEQQANKTTKIGGEVLLLGEMSGETKYGIHGDVYIEIHCSEDGEKDEEHSPVLVTTSNSLLPPLVDDDNDGKGNQKVLLPDIGIGKKGRTGVSKQPNMPLSKPARLEAASASYTPPRDMNACVSSPLSAGSCLLSANGSSDSSLSMARSSLIFDSDDGSNDHIAYLTKSNFKPPKEVVTITSGPVLANNPEIPYKTPAKRRKHNLPKQNQNAIKIEEEEDNEKCCDPLGSNRKGTSGTRDRRKKETSSDVEDDEKKTAQELAVRLVGDLEAMREEHEKCLSKNRRLETKLQILKAQQDEHMVHRGRLIKACLYTAPVFVLCGGLDAFLATILLVWVLVEVESYLDGSEGNNEDGDCMDDDSDREGESDSDDGFGDDGSSMSL